MRHRVQRNGLLPRFVIGICGLLAVFSLGTMLKSGAADQRTFTSQVRKSDTSDTRDSKDAPAQLRTAANLIKSEAAVPNPIIQPPRRSEEAPALKQPVQAESVYICGAATKKGTPCSRRVKGNTRCFQHTGMPAMLPPEKLRVG